MNEYDYVLKSKVTMDKLSDETKSYFEEEQKAKTERQLIRKANKMQKMTFK